jgi:hypothetical protein
VNALERWFFAPAPATRLAGVRWLCLGFAVVYLVGAASPLLRPMSLPKSAFHPTGIVSILRSPLPAAVVVGLYGACIATGVLALVGKWYRTSAPAFALLLLWVTSYRNSWGMLFHTENLLVLHVAVLACCPQAADVWTWTSSSATSTSEPSDQAERYGWPLRVLSLVTVSAYVVSGLAKLIHAGPGWLGGDEIRAHIAYDAIRKLELGSLHSPLGVALVKMPWVFTPLSLLTLAFELGAPVALLGGRFALVWAITCYGFHAGVLALMMILFPYPLCGVAFASLFPAERWVDFVLRRLGLQGRLGALRRQASNG